jgi:hypothetical protein
MIMFHLSPETEYLLQEKAARHGQSLEAYLQELAEREAHQADKAARPTGERISAVLWVGLWRAWARDHPASVAVVDDRRESIYDGRGE